MSAEYFALAFAAALNPKLLAIDLLLAQNRPQWAMFLCVLLGGLTVALMIGLLDVLVCSGCAGATTATRVPEGCAYLLPSTINASSS